MKTQTFDSDGVCLRGWEIGSGPRLLLTHGWSQSSRLFKPLAESLAHDFTVTAFDMRGHGTSDAPPSGYTIGQLGIDLHNVLTELEVDQNPISILGHSMGCSVIWKYIDVFGSDSLSSALFVDQAPRVLTSTIQEPAPARMAKMTYSMLQARIAALRSPFTSYAYVDAMFTEAASHDLRQLAKEENKLLKRASAADLLLDASLQDWRLSAAHLDLPVLIVGNELGAYPTEDLRDMAQKIQTATYTEFAEADGGAHLVFLENPDMVAARIKSFLLKHQH